MEISRKIYGQVCQDEQLTKEFRELHVELVDRVIEFCKDHKITIDEFSLFADGLRGSIEEGSWKPCTDSSMSLHVESESEPFLFSM